MADESAGRSGDVLDPRHYVEHVTRTALLLEQLARDVNGLRILTESSVRGTDALRVDLARQDRESAVYRAENTADVRANTDRIDKIEERLRWLSRLIVGAVVAGVISGVLGIVWAALK